jgi:hypothetical protein
MQHSKTTHNAPLHGLPLLRQQPPHHYAGVGRSTVPGHSAQHERGVRTSACVQVSAWGGRAWIGLPNLGEVMTGCVAYAHTRTAPALFSAAAAEQSVLPVIRACDVCVCACMRTCVRAHLRAMFACARACVRTCVPPCALLCARLEQTTRRGSTVFASRDAAHQS